jgi:putative transposase
LKYAFIQSESKEHKVKQLCDALEVSTSGYYGWLGRPESNRAKDNRRLIEKIRHFHQASRGIYGSPRVYRDVLASGERTSVNRVARLMKKQGIQSKMARKFVITTDSKKTMAPAPDKLQRHFRTERQDEAWVSDTTAIATRQGWLYLAVVLDLFSRQVIGWSMGDNNNACLVSDALMMAIKRRGKANGVIVHSDQGSTYASGDYQTLLDGNGLVCSMSRKGECLDNAVAESFFGSLKTEWAYHEDYRTKSEARQSLFEYIEIFYNRQRRHSYIGYISPAKYEARFASY